MGRRSKNVNESGRWTQQVGEHGSVVRIRERTPAGRLQLVYGDSATGRRIEHYAATETVRTPNGAIDPALVAAVLVEARDLAARLRIARAAEAIDPARITVEQGFARFHGERGGLPRSKSALVHHRSARRFWVATLGKLDGGRDRHWNLMLPAEVDAALKPLVESGKIPLAEKYVRVLRTVTRWLRDKAGYDGVKDPTRHIDLRKLREGHTPRQPRYTRAQLVQLLAVAYDVDPRFHFALTWADDTGARSAALYRAMRSQVDCALDVTPTAEQAPHGWCMLPALKGQRAALVLLTAEQRRVLDAALLERWNGVRMVPGYLSRLERSWQDEGIDYPLIPGGRFPRSGVFGPGVKPVSKGTLDNWLREAETKADVPHVDRRGWHGVRRSWTDYSLDLIGLEAVTAAGAWSDSEMPSHVYAERIRLKHLEAARLAAERKREES